MNSNNVISLKIGNKIIFHHPISQLNNITKKNQIIPVSKIINNDVIPKFILQQDKTNEEFEKRINNEEKLLRKIMKGYFSWGKQSFINEISKEEEQINNIEKLIQKNKLNDNNKFKEMIGVLNQKSENLKLNKYNNNNITNEMKKEIINKISNNKKVYSDILGLNKKNIALINGHLTFIKETAIKENNKLNQKNETNKENDKDIDINNNINKTEQSKNSFKKINIIKKEYIESFRNFIGNNTLSERIIISYFDINHPNIKMAAQKYFKSKYGTDEINLIYIYKKSPNETFNHKFKLISDISELFNKAKKENFENPKLFLKSGKEIKNNRKIRCIGGLNLDNNDIINII